MAESFNILMLEDNTADAEIIQQFLIKVTMNCQFTLMEKNLIKRKNKKMRAFPTSLTGFSLVMVT